MLRILLALKYILRVACFINFLNFFPNPDILLEIFSDCTTPKWKCDLKCIYINHRPLNELDNSLIYEQSVSWHWLERLNQISLDKSGVTRTGNCKIKL